MSYRTSILGPRVLFALGLFALTLAGVTGLNVTHEPPVAASTVVASREILVQGSPADANGQVLQLVRYDIPPGVVLAMHTHPGMQIAWIESGVLTYTVVSGGSIPVTRAAHDGTPESSEEIGPGQTTELHPGDAVVEIDGVVHYGQNIGRETVVILAATLLDPNQPPAVVVTPTPSVAATPAS